MLKVTIHPHINRLLPLIIWLRVTKAMDDVCLIPLPNSYYITEVRLSWSKARSRCRSFYTDLAILSGIWENSNAQRLLTPDVPAWIGLSRNTWSWTNLNPSRFRNWLREETSDPGHDCALINPSALYRWEEENCSTTLPFLCYSDDDQTTAGTL
uniref:C-type lectin domain-containing protein n=1 Tax=Astyanax mexicanus TaxID=7994 RepID=A0A3B1KLQ3_ASTMX